ncbi:MBL fold metallo-hydrolase [Carbonactinospora thermoautotrophica]|uniref:MBL fold metallo-hydrolase n=1 Tax=Carbonactinospora thermoautotrophica TaxID=1469144 RepID=UPI00226F33FF|nr:MBL fold metallo-hydrolase [Carbonactinospora thermoautotrophica]MCX9190103.1 MBL fold metallo-hydrolase [Carbonactinospora thermoautotrophica]
MRLTILGCAGSFPAPDSPCSCYLVEADGYRLLLDLGTGALGNLQQHIGLDEVDAVLLSHLHADHCLDLCGYYVVRTYHPDGPLPRIPVYGPAGTADRMARAYDLPLDPGMRKVFDFRTLVPGGFELGPFTIRADHVNHPVEAFAFRVEYGGRSLVYSGDTGESDALVRLASRADLMLCEASFQDGRDTARDLHLNGREAGEHAARAGVGRLVLTHIPAWTDAGQNLADAQAVYAGPVDLARAHAVYEL